MDAASDFDLLLTMAHYHGWATRVLLAALAPLSDAEWRQDCGLFFHSVHGTLNHLLLVERLWWDRFAGRATGPVQLDAEIEADRDRLQAALLAEAEQWPTRVQTPASDMLAYRNSQGQPRQVPWRLALMHVFNHATHHRGQISAAVTQLGYPVPEMDLAYYGQQLVSGSRS